MGQKTIYTLYQQQVSQLLKTFKLCSSLHISMLAHVLAVFFI